MYTHIINPRKFNWKNLPMSTSMCPPVRVRVPRGHGHGHGQGHGRGRGHGQMDTDRDRDTWTWADPDVTNIETMTHNLYIRHYILFDILSFYVLSHSALFLFDILSHSLLFLFDILSHSAFITFDILSLRRFVPFDILYHSTFCHSALCPIRHFVVRRFVLSAFVTSTFCRWTVKGTPTRDFSSPVSFNKRLILALTGTPGKVITLNKIFVKFFQWVIDSPVYWSPGNRFKFID